ncbi:mechanosensitive ion channel domain-containing protein [Legionella sp. km772]|uniref:mechanosensitive ion channel domain-containing protein n=1 Tax=Legionella sp. km772 TaxID=2498111 RepID=UPI000F8D7A95|nr:mechanosensitive ion channel domain-containing protein [Legionella sp. km772]RUR12957.1 mechanosensitive ion channel [Legionella sp. km772]
MMLLIALLCYQGLYAAEKKEQFTKIKDNPSTLIEYLAQEKNFLNIAINNAKQYVSPKDKKEFDNRIDQIKASLTIVDAKIESLNSFLENEKKQSLELNQKLKYLQQLPLNNDEINIQERVAKTETLLTVSNKTLELINENINLAQQLKIELSEETRKLQVWQEHFDLEQKLLIIKTKKAKLNEELFNLYQTNLNQEKDNKSGSISPAIKIDHQAGLLINNQHIALVHYDLNRLNIEKRTIKADISLLNNLDTKNLQAVVDIYKETIVQILGIENSLQQLKGSLDKELDFVNNSALKKIIIRLKDYLTQQLEASASLKQTLTTKLDNYQNQLKRLISTRQSLAQYNINSWPIILNKMAAIPAQFYKYIKTLSLKVYDSYSWLELLPTVILWVLLATIFIFFIVFNHFLKSLEGNKERSRLTGYLYDGVLVLIQRNIPYLCLLAMLRVVFYFTSISFANYQLLTSLITVWFTFRVLILIARLALLERLSDVSGKDVKLYYRLKWLFLFGGWTTALMVLGHLMPLAIIVQDIFNRLFMLFILTVSLVLWKSKDIIPYLLKPFLSEKKRYVRNAVSLLIILIPITLFTTAVIGLFGFINLAWTMSGYEAYTLSVLVGYIIARGLTADLLELLSEWMISSLENGWLWIEVFLKPLDKILRIILLLFSIFIMFQILGWNSDSLVMISLNKAAHYTIINFTGIHITVQSIIEFFIVLAIFVWAAKWTREFCYRWLYVNAKDVALRNSLSIFTQYAVIILGGFITLHVLGLDLSGMSMILGGLAVGMGFGLRDFASNIVGGIMLLIERPVREGDLITLGEHEGRVAHIGIRTMRVSSWDNMEVLIPNAETFNKPFTNWTLQDSIVRTVIPIKVCRSDDPTVVQQLILDVLAIIPEIVPDPPAQVFLKKIDEALVEFEVRYFINVQTHSRVEIRSKVLFAITAQFKAAGIKPPVEPVAIEIKEGHHDALNSPKAKST